MTHLWPCQGTLNDTKTILTFDSTGPSFSGDDKMAPYQDIITILGKDEHTLTAMAPNGAGGWKQFMKCHYNREK
ncbi:hypothetical protein BH11PLA2_BH11PLA2_47930 [soil metagenome]